MRTTLKKLRNRIMSWFYEPDLVSESAVTSAEALAIATALYAHKSPPREAVIGVALRQTILRGQDPNPRPYERRCIVCKLWTTGSVSVVVNGFVRIEHACVEHENEAFELLVWKGELNDRVS